MDKAKRKRIKRYLTWAAMAGVVLVLTVMPLLAKQEAQAEGPRASILSGTVKTGSVGTALHGGGNLEAGEAENVKLPEGVKITEFLVKNGDVVAQGDPVARVDKVSVMTAVTQVADTMDYLQEEMESARDDTVSSKVRAKAGGRVKILYAREGDSVQDVILEHGALAVLSLDSLMAVEIEENMAVSTGDTVLLTFPDDTQAEGRVESNLNGKIVITVEDEGYPVGEAVVVHTADGERIGSGKLYVHNAWNAVAFTGTVKAVKTKEEATVSEGSTLFTLEDTSFTAQLEYLSGLHREYEQLMQELLQMHDTGYITAPCGGTVSGVEEDNPFLLAGTQVDWEMVPLTAGEEKGWTVMLLSDTEQETAPTETTPPEQTEPTETLPGETVPGVEGSQFVGYAGRVTTVGVNGLILSMNTTAYPVSYSEEGGWDLSQVSTDTQLMLASNILYPAEDVSSYTVGDIIVILYDTAGNYMGMVTAVKAQPETPVVPSIPGMGDLSGLLGGLGGSGGMSGVGGMGSYGGMTGQQEEDPLFDLEGQVLMTITGQEAMKLTITLDEQDISRVKPGQVAQVKVSALKGQTFEAEVTQVAISGTNNGGSSKFTVELTLDKAENMLPGMSATASIPMATRLETLTVPAAALKEIREKTVVYTALDPETGEPANPVEVVTGLSDGENVEILEGLRSGDSFYYSYYDTLELDHSAVESRFGF